MGTNRRAKRQKLQRRRQILKRPASALRRASHWPVSECWMSDHWRDPGTLVEVLLARRPATGDPDAPVAAGVFLVDLGCLGLKNTFGRIMSGPEYRILRTRMTDGRALSRVDPGLAVMVIREGIAYAQNLGFEPQRDFRDSGVLIEDIPAADATDQLHLGGPDGKPFYVAGPHDDGPRIMQHLAQRLGHEGVDFLVPADPQEDE